MKIKIAQLIILALFLFGIENARAISTVSYLPRTGLAQYVVDNLDLSTISSSLGPRRTEKRRTFATLDVQPVNVTEDVAELSGDNWSYKVRVLERGDLNRDGIEDVLICFADTATKGTYSSTKAYLLTKYSAETPLIAIGIHVESPRCMANAN